MTAPHADQLIDGYLARLRVLAADLPASGREELVSDVRTHIAEARQRESNETDATILNILDRLGEPDVLVGEAGQRPAPATQVQSTAETGHPYQPTILELAIPGLLVLLWPIGIILLWYATAWNGRDKVIGTLLTLGGYPWVAILVVNISHGLLPGTPVGGVLAFVIAVMPAVVAGYMTYRLRWGRRLKTVTA